MNIRTLAIKLMPPIITDALRALIPRRGGRLIGQSAPPEWSYVPQGWAYPARGWNHASVAQAMQAQWADLPQKLRGPHPLLTKTGVQEATPAHFTAQSNILVFAYLLARVALGKEKVSLLDWGGGAGQYYAYARAMLPEIPLDYSCKEVAQLAAVGRRHVPEGRFTDSDDEAFARRYDLVFASGAIQFVQDIDPLIARLCGAAQEWLFVTRLPVVEKTDDFVIIQHPYAYGYDTEYLCWVFNRARLLARVERHGFKLEREFLLNERPVVANAPEALRYAGFLFRRVS